MFDDTRLAREVEMERGDKKKEFKGCGK